MNRSRGSETYLPRFVLFCFHFCWATLEGSLRSLTPPRFFPPCFAPFPNGRLTFFFGGGLVRFLFFGGKKENKILLGVLRCVMLCFFLLTTYLRRQLAGNRCLCRMVWANLSRITTTENIAVWEMLALVCGVVLGSMGKHCRDA